LFGGAHGNRRNKSTNQWSNDVIREASCT
jgi:hypothetical protein